MNFAQVKGISIPQGSVKQLAQGQTVLWKQGGAPVPYDAQVEYIQSDGQAYIDLGFKATQAISFSLEVYRPSNSVRWDCGAEEGWSSRITRLLMEEGANKYAVWRFGTNGATNMTSTSNCIGDLRLRVNGKNVSIDNLTSGITYNNQAPTANAFTTPGNFLLFGIDVNGVASVAAASSGSRFKAGTITDTGVDLDLIAVRIGQEGYLYDRNSGTLYPNAGTGAFVLGPDVPTAPQEEELSELYGVAKIGTPNNDGTIGSGTKRAYIRFVTFAQSISIRNLPSDWFVAVHLCDSGYVIGNNLGWQNNLEGIDLQGYNFIQLVFKYGSAGTATITDAMLEGLTGYLATSFQNDTFTDENSNAVKLYNPYKSRPANAYKGQLHCHTTNSDGADSPATVAGEYVALGYDFMTITDHNYITPDPGVAGIVWMGTSYEDTRNSARYQHMGVFNVDAVYQCVSAYQSNNTPWSLVEHYVKNGGGILAYNHPEYPTVYASDATLKMLPRGISFMEIFNGSIQTLVGTVATASELPAEAYFDDMYDCTGDGNRYVNTSKTYDTPNWVASDAATYPDGNLDRGFRLQLDAWRKIFCIAVDDYHTGTGMINRGWMVAFAESKTKESIWAALIRGCSYASTGVTLSALQVSNGTISLTIAGGAGAVTTFYGPGNRVLATVSGSSASYQIQGTEKYVRAMVQIGREKAWTQPVWILE